MEIKRKKITVTEIFDHEQKSAAEIKNVCNEMEEAFHAIGYELDLEFGQKDHEAQRLYDTFETEGEKKFASGYVSRAMIKVKRKRTEEELLEHNRMIETNRAMIASAETAEEAEQLENDEKLRIADEELKLTVAFTEVMIVRAYQSFWTEWISLGENTAQLKADLDEFLDRLTERQAEAE